MPPTFPPRLSRRAALAHLARFAASVPIATALGTQAAQANGQPPETVPEETPPETPQGANTPPPNPKPAALSDLDAVLAAKLKTAAQSLPEALDEADGYGGWKHHIGKPDEAVCRVRVTVFDGGTSGTGQTVREGSGIVVRCDGWIMVPEGLFGPDRALQKNAKISISFRAADGPVPPEPLSPPFPPRFHSAKTDYVLVKVNGHHFKGLHLLDVRNLALQMPVRVVWAAPSAQTPQSPAKAKLPAPALAAPARNATIGARDATSSVPHFALVFADTDAANADVPPLGAAVIEPSCGAVLGIVTVSDAKGVWFSPFGYFQYISNEIGLKVSINDVLQPGSAGMGDVSQTGQMLGMVKVPGGPTRLHGEAGNTYRALYGTDVVCTPDFFIDAHPLTIGAYRDWISRVPGPRQPLGWLQNDELKTHDRNPNMPLTGVISDDALRYAAGHNKRLPTPVEWTRASLGVETEWLGRLVSEWKNIANDQQYFAFNKVKVFGDTIGKMMGRYANSPKKTVPPNAITSPELDELSRQQMRLYQTYWDKKDRWFPYQPSPIDFYKKDVSQWFVHEMLTNVPELCQPNYAARVTEPAPKFYPTPADPYLSPSNLYDWLINCLPNDMDANFTAFLADQKNARVYIINRAGLYSPGNVTVEPRTGMGFRCAL